MKKILPYLAVVVLTVAATHLIDRQTIKPEPVDTQKLIQPYVDIIKSMEVEIEAYEEIVQDEDSLQHEFQVRQDSVITVIRDANENRDFARLDSIGDNLLDRLRARRQH